MNNTGCLVKVYALKTKYAIWIQKQQLIGFRSLCTLDLAGFDQLKEGKIWARYSFLGLIGKTRAEHMLATLFLKCDESFIYWALNKMSVLHASNSSSVPISCKNVFVLECLLLGSLQF